MRAMLVLTLALGLLAGSAVAQKDVPRMTLRVGESRLWSPGYPCSMVVCDDPSVVRVEDAKTTLRLTGLRQGSTLCGFYASKGGRKVIGFDVKK